MTYFSRLALYFRVMFPLSRAAITAVIAFFSFILLIGHIHGDTTLFYTESWFALVSLFLYSIIFRLNDEIKDDEFDKQFNPDRPLVTGEVKYSDIKILAVILFIIITIINLDKGVATSAFLAWIVFLCLSARWFYFPDEVRPSFFLTTITHQPILPLTYIYIYATYIHITGNVFNFWQILPLALLFSFTYIGWEVARKTRAPEDETEYETYSQRWGVKKATRIPMIYIALSTIGMVAVGFIYQLSWYFIVANALAGVIALFFFIRFFINPVSKNNQLRAANEYYDLAFRLIMIAELVTVSLI